MNVVQTLSADYKFNKIETIFLSKVLYVCLIYNLRRTVH